MTRWVALTSALAGSAPAVLRRDELGERARRVLAALRVRLEVNTATLSVPGERGTLIVANHLSWLDILGVLTIEPAGFLAKRELRRWPVIGRIAAGCGTRFIDRQELRGLPAIVAELAETLRSGRSMMIFPEGTTWCRLPGGEFRRAAFQAAIDADAPIRPVTFQYLQGETPSTIASFVGDDGLLTSVRRVTRARDLRLRITAHPALKPIGDRRQLAARAQAVVRGCHTTPHIPARRTPAETNRAAHA